MHRGARFSSANGSRPTSFELQQIAVDPTGINRTATYVYDAVGNVISEDGPRSDADVTAYAYDSRRLPTLKTAPTAGGATPKTRYTYDGNARRVKTENSLGTIWATATLAYDTRGLVIQRIGPDGSPITQTYDEAGRPYETAQTVDGVDRRARNVLDPGGRVTAIKLAANTPLEQAVAAVTYSPNGKVLTQTDASGHISAFCYDGFDRLIERRYPAPVSGSAPTCASLAAGEPLPGNTTRERYIYAANGDLASFVLRDGRSIAFAYDNLGRLIGKDVPDADRDVTYVYDLLGRLTQANLPGANAALSLAWSYDKAGRVLTATGPYGRTVTRAYGPAFDWTELQWPDATRVRYTSDALGRVTAIEDQAGPTPLAAFSYDELSRRTTVTHGGSGTTAYAYGGRYRLLRLTHDFAGAERDVVYGYFYNEAGEIKSRTVSRAAFEITAPDNVVRTYRPAAGTASGGNGLNQYLRIDPGPTTFGYDPNGNLIRDTDPQRRLTYGYDAENRLISASEGTLAQTTLAYDAIGRLAEVRQGPAATRFLNDGDELVGEYDGTSGSLLRRTVHGPAVNEPLVVEEGGTRTWLYGDERGSVVALADAAGVSATINTYGVFGEPGADNRGRFGFIGQAWLAEIGLGYFKARIYSPALGRFLQTDPIGEAGGMNLYRYAENDPTNMVDPDGLQGVPVALPEIRIITPSINLAALSTQITAAAISSAQNGARLATILPSPCGIGLCQSVDELIANSRPVPLAYPHPEHLNALASLHEAAIAASASTDAVLPGWTPGWLRGIFIHSKFAAIVRTMRPQFDAEVSYKNGTDERYGLFGTVRADAIFGPRKSPSFAVELKTGGAYLSVGEYYAYVRHLPPGTPIYSIKVP